MAKGCLKLFLVVMSLTSCALVGGSTQVAFTVPTSFMAPSEKCVPNFSEYVIFDRVSYDNILARQKYVGTLLDEQASTRTRTVIGLSVAALGLVAGSGMYIYKQYHQPADNQAAAPDNTAEKSLEAHFIESWKESHTFTGAVKAGIRSGLGFAVATASLAAGTYLLNQAGLLSWQRTKDNFYPTEETLCDHQEESFKNYFEYLESTLHKLELELIRVSTPEQLEEFIKWRGLVSIEMKTSIKTVVRSVESFGAIAFELMARKAAQGSQEELPIQQFNEMTEWISELVMAVNDFTQVLEDTVNAKDLTQFQMNRAPVAMVYRKTLHVARNAMQRLHALVPAIQ